MLKLLQWGQSSIFPFRIHTLGSSFIPDTAFQSRPNSWFSFPISNCYRKDLGIAFKWKPWIHVMWSSFHCLYRQAHHIPQESFWKISLSPSPPFIYMPPLVLFPYTNNLVFSLSVTTTWFSSPPQHLPSSAPIIHAACQHCSAEPILFGFIPTCVFSVPHFNRMRSFCSAQHCTTASLSSVARRSPWLFILNSDHFLYSDPGIFPCGVKFQQCPVSLLSHHLQMRCYVFFMELCFSFSKLSVYVWEHYRKFYCPPTYFNLRERLFFSVDKPDLTGLGKGKIGIQQNILPWIKSLMSPKRLIYADNVTPSHASGAGVGTLRKSCRFHSVSIVA